MREHERAVAPLEPVPLELEPPECGRRSRERVEGAEDVVSESRLDQLRRPHRAARLRLGLEDVDRPARVGEHVRSDEPVRPGPDHDGVRHPADMLSQARWDRRPKSP